MLAGAHREGSEVEAPFARRRAVGVKHAGNGGDVPGEEIGKDHACRGHLALTLQSLAAALGHDALELLPASGRIHGIVAGSESGTQQPVGRDGIDVVDDCRVPEDVGIREHGGQALVVPVEGHRETEGHIGPRAVRIVDDPVDGREPDFGPDAFDGHANVHVQFRLDRVRAFSAHDIDPAIHGHHAGHNHDGAGQQYFDKRETRP